MMKFLSILAAASLALTPAIAGAGSSGDSTDNTANGHPISGPLAGRVLDQPRVPVGAIVVGGLVLIGGAIVCLLACGGSSSSDSNNSTNN